MRIALLLTLSLSACTAQPDDSKPLVHQDANDAAARAALDEAREEQEEVFEEQVRKVAPTLRFESVDLGPDEPRIGDVLEVQARLREGHSPFAEIDYTWYVNGNDLRGVNAESLDQRRGHFKKFDRIKVVASATDEQGGATEMASNVLIIANSTPTILTDISGQSGLNGLRLKAEDADDDPLTWSIADGPPGVTIDSRGTLRVNMRNLDEGYNGEVVIAVEDPDGARSELHIPVNVNAAEAGRVEESVVKKTRGRMDGTMDDYAKAQEKAVENIDKMSPAEFDKYMADQEKKAHQ